MRAVLDLRVVLHAGHPTNGILEGRYRGTGRGSRDGKAVGRNRDAVTMRHPDVLRCRKAGEQCAGRRDRQLGASELAQARLGHCAAESIGHRLESIADAEHRDSEIEYRRIKSGGAIFVHAGRPTREHDGCRLLLQDLGGSDGVRNDLGVDASLADAAGDQLGVLRAKIHDKDQLRGAHLSSLSSPVWPKPPASGRTLQVAAAKSR